MFSKKRLNKNYFSETFNVINVTFISKVTKSNESLANMSNMRENTLKIGQYQIQFLLII